MSDPVSFPRLVEQRSLNPQIKIDAVRPPLQSARLREIFAELTVRCREDGEPPFTLSHNGSVLVLDRYARVRINAATGHFVFTSRDPLTPFVLTTPSHLELMAAIVAHLSRDIRGSIPQNQFNQIDHCVGMSLGDVERVLILATLRRCGGNRTHAAGILGIAPRTLRNKLSGYQCNRALTAADNVPVASAPSPNSEQALAGST